MDNAIICPYCGKSFAVTDAVRGQLEHEFTRKHKEDTEKLKKKIEETVKKELEEKTTVEIRDLHKQVREQNIKLEAMRDHELKLREEKRQLEEAKKDLALEAARKMDEERRKVEEAAVRKITEEYFLKNREKDKIIDDLRKSLEEVQRKAVQGSEQLQGEVLELDVEQVLSEAFPQDVIEPVGKGIKGADVRQTVRSPRGVRCGVILWESKRTKHWSGEWIQKLKDDLRAEKSDVPVIVTTTFPRDIKDRIVLVDGVWVCSHSFVVILATLLRKNLLDVTYQKMVSQHKGEKAEYLYEYITGHEFRQQVEAIVEAYQEMHEQIMRERISFEKSWKQRESQVRRLITGTASFYGSMQGLIGSALPHVKGLELPQGDKEE